MFIGKQTFVATDIQQLPLLIAQNLHQLDGYCLNSIIYNVSYIPGAGFSVINSRSAGQQPAIASYSRPQESTVHTATAGVDRSTFSTIIC